jgi:hypothetical protein
MKPRFLYFLFALNVYIEGISVEYLPITGTPPPSRELAGLVYDSKAHKVYIYGGRSESIYDDMWEFDLNARLWIEMHSPATMSPGARANQFMTILDESRQVLLFGGDTGSGPISDVWLYDLDSESVTFTQWKMVDTRGKAPPRAYYRAVCDFIYEGKHYIAVYGGKDRSGYLNSLYV